MRSTRWLRPILAMLLAIVAGQVARADNFPRLVQLPNGEFAWVRSEEQPESALPQPPWVFSLANARPRPQVDLTAVRVLPGVAGIDPAQAWERPSRDPRKQLAKTDGDWVVLSS